MNPGFNSQNQGQGYPNDWGAPTLDTSVANSSPEVRADFLRSTYMLFMSGILTAVVAGWLTLSNYGILKAAVTLVSNPLIAVVLILGGSFAAQAVARTPGLNLVGLYGFTGLMGFLFAPLIALYAPAVVGQAAFLTVLIFGALTAYALISRQNFSFMGGMLFVGMIAIIGAALANVFFFKSSNFSYWIAWGTLFLSSGFVLYETSNMVHTHTPRDNVAAALSLFISFFNIFLSLLRILGGGSRD